MKKIIAFCIAVISTISLDAQENGILWRYMIDNIYNSNLQGNVGIGTLFPEERLTVSGNIRANALRTNGIIIGSQVPAIAYPFDYETIGVSNVGFNLRLQTPNSIFFHTGIDSVLNQNPESNVRLSILQNGNVGVGTLIPSTSLSVKTTFSSVNQNEEVKTFIGTTNSGAAGLLETRGANGNPNFRVTTNGANQGFAGVYNSAGASSARMYATTIGAGYLNTLGSGGENTFLAGGTSSGFARVYNSSGSSRAEMNVLSGAGYLSTLSSSGNRAFYAGGSSSGFARVSDNNGSTRAEMYVLSGAGEMALRGANNSYNIRLTSVSGNANNGFLAIYNSSGNSRVNSSIFNSGTGYIETLGGNGRRNFLIGGSNSGYMGIYDEDARIRTNAGIQSNGAGYLRTYGSNGNTNFYVGGGNTGWAYVYNSGGTSRAGIDILSSGAGYIETTGHNGRDNVRLTTISGDANKGFVAVIDGGGTTEAGIYVNSSGNGQMFADVKNFRMEHPTQPGKDIWYACIEGPEAAAYERGTGTLKNGEAFVPFSEHFELVVNPQTLTVILTPHSVETFGLAVIKKTPRGILVKELTGGMKNRGKGNFSFDWEVKGVRKGYEDYRVIRDADEDLPAVAEDRELALPEEEDEISENPDIEGTIPGGNDTLLDNSSAKDQVKSELGQNRPNPFSQQTIIPFFIAPSVQQADLLIYSLGGQLVKEIKIGDRGEGQIEVDISNMPNGSYFYTLVLDQQLIDTKQMVLNQ